MRYTILQSGRQLAVNKRVKLMGAAKRLTFGQLPPARPRRVGVDANAQI